MIRFLHWGGPTLPLGYKPDRTDARDRMSSLLDLKAPPPSASLEQHIERVQSQGATSSCVGHAVANALHVALRAAGVGSALYPSRRFVYYCARAYNGDETADDGTYIRDAMRAVRKLGYCPEQDMPWHPAKVNKAPSAMAYMRAHDHRGLRGYYRIETLSPEERHDRVARAIASGRPVVFGMSVDKAFLEDSGNAVIGEQGASVGGHAMCAVGYKPGHVRVLNSWGSDWRDKGLCWMTLGAMAGWRDVWVVDPIGAGDATA